jgi:hypothetical protein
MASITSPPSISSTLRRPMDRLVPITVCTSVVSVVRRDSTSPVWVVSKYCGLMLMTWRYTALRTSAVTRSPSQDTR